MLHIRTALLLPFGLKPNTQEWLFDPHPPSLVELPAGAHRDEVVREALRCAPGTLEGWDSSKKLSAPSCGCGLQRSLSPHAAVAVGARVCHCGTTVYVWREGEDVVASVC